MLEGRKASDFHHVWSFQENYTGWKSASLPCSESRNKTPSKKSHEKKADGHNPIAYKNIKSNLLPTANIFERKFVYAHWIIIEFNLLTNFIGIIWL